MDRQLRTVRGLLPGPSRSAASQVLSAVREEALDAEAKTRHQRALATFGKACDEAGVPLVSGLVAVFAAFNVRHTSTTDVSIDVHSEDGDLLTRSVALGFFFFWLFLGMSGYYFVWLPSHIIWQPTDPVCPRGLSLTVSWFRRLPTTRCDPRLPL